MDNQKIIIAILILLIIGAIFEYHKQNENNQTNTQKKVTFSTVDDSNYGNPNDVNDNYANHNNMPAIQNMPISGNDYAQSHQTSPDYKLNEAASYERMKQQQFSEQGNVDEQYAPNAYKPYDVSHSYANANVQNFPEMEENSQQYPRGCQSTEIGGYELNVDSLMPSGWKSKSLATSEASDNGNWTKFAPSKQSFNRYITAAGSARLAMNTRNALSRNVGIPLLIRSGVRTPISTEQVLFGDSSFRQDEVFNATGVHPKNTHC